MFALTVNQTTLLVAFIGAVATLAAAGMAAFVGLRNRRDVKSIKGDVQLGNVAIGQISDAVNHVDADSNDQRALRAITQDNAVDVKTLIREVRALRGEFRNHLAWHETERER